MAYSGTNRKTVQNCPEYCLVKCFQYHQIRLIPQSELFVKVCEKSRLEAGHRRAEALSAILRDAEIDVIYTSEYRRTKQTGEAIAQALEIPLETMPKYDVADLVTRLHTQHAVDTVLIVSHSGVIPRILREFGYSQYVTISKADYDNLFIIVPRVDMPPLVLRLRYQ
jgi:hypothetical protein